MITFKRTFFSLLIYTLAIALGATASAAPGGKGNGKSNGKTNENTSSTVLTGNGNGKSKGKAIGLVNRLDGSTIEYASSTTEIAGDSETESESDSETESEDNPETEESPETNAIVKSDSGNGNAFGKSKNVGQGNASNGLKARIVTNQDIVYTGQSLEIGFHFARGSELITDGLADAFLVIFSPPAGEPSEPIVLPLNPVIEDITEGEGSTEEGGSSETTGEESTAIENEVEAEEEPAVEEEAGPRNLFSVPIVDDLEIPAGTYQLGLILTKPDGHPLDVDTWYNGLLGLVHVRGLTISAEALPADADGDGMMDCDPELDGLTCEQSEDASTSDDTGTDDSSTGTSDVTI
ncbi:MAG: hypothetical protein KJN90_13755 [Gammaproteobacteria bacterium]|nr:hypothetical protein [Gammaproteobacteria bacterium]